MYIDHICQPLLPLQRHCGPVVTVAGVRGEPTLHYKQVAKRDKRPSDKISLPGCFPMAILLL